MAQQKISRRKFAASLGATAAVAAAAGFLGGYSTAPAKVGEAVAEKTVTLERTVEKTPAAGPIKLGSGHPLTGYDAENGQEMHRGVEMAVQEINAKGGILGRQLEWIELDTEDMSPDKVSAVWSALATQHNVDAFIFGYGYCEFPTLARYAKTFMHAVVMRCWHDWAVANPDKLYLAWQAAPEVGVYGTGLAKLLDTLRTGGLWKPPNNNVFLMTGQNAYGQIISQEFRTAAEKRGWTIIGEETIPTPTVEYGPVLAKIRANPPAVIVNTDYMGSDMAAFMNQFRENPTKSLIYSQYAPSMPDFRKLAGNNANGVVWGLNCGFLPPSIDPISKMWYDKYHAKYNAEPAAYAAICYDMTWMWANAVAIAGTLEQHAVAKILESMAFRGTCGGYYFTPTHETYSYPAQTNDPSLGEALYYFQIKNLKDVTMSPEPYVTGAFELPPWL